MLHCIGKVLSRNDKFNHFRCIHTKKFIKERILFSASVSFFYDQYTNLKWQSQHVLNRADIVQSGIIVNSESHNQRGIMSKL